VTGGGSSEHREDELPEALRRPALPKRFYKDVSVEQVAAGYAVRLDGRPLRTPGKAELVLPTAGLAEAAAAEWRNQGDHIDPTSMPLTRLINSAIDGVTGREREVIADMARYAGSDMLCYRAGYPAELVALQCLHWDPIIAWAQRHLDRRFVLAEGVMYVAQPAGTVEAVAQRLDGSCTLRLAALHTVTSLTGSVLIALALAAGALTPDAAWGAAHVDEDWQISQWGDDSLAAARRAQRRRDFDAAVLALSALAA
jgi:chaperone required for assembly of F1-ATPase